MARPVGGDGVEGETPARVSWETLDSAETVEAADQSVSRGRHAAPTSVSRLSRARGPLRWIVEVLVVIIVVAAAVIGVRAFIAAPASITSEAMSNTLALGDRVIVSPLPTRINGVQRGEVVAFTDPAGWWSTADDAREPSLLTRALSVFGLATAPGDEIMVLRVVAVGGQRITCCDDDGRLELDGVPLIEPYLRPGVPTDQVLFDVVVPQGRVFVLGDDRAVARDSRYHLQQEQGTVAIDDLTGRVVFVAWPLDRWGPVGIATGSAG